MLDDASVHEWRAKKAKLRRLEAERKETDARICKKLNAELEAARKAKDWENEIYWL